MTECTVTDSQGQLITLRIKMNFATRQDATDLIKAFVLAQGRSVRQCRKRTGKNRTVYICTSKTECSFVAIVAKARGKRGEGFFLSSFVAEHNGCTGVAKPTAKQVCAMASTVACVQGDPSVKGKTLISQVKSLDGVTISNRMSYRVRDSIAAARAGSYEDGCQRLESLLSLFCSSNPGAGMAFEVDADKRFRRAFLSNPDVSVIQKSAQRILGFDGAFMKTLGHKNTMLILVGRDGNKKNIVMAVGLVPCEDTANCQWFMLNSMKAGIQMCDVPFFMDHGKAGIAAGSTLGLKLHFCTRHIAGNMKKIFKGRFTPEHEKQLFQIQRAKCAENYESMLVNFGVNNHDMEEYIRRIPPANWVLYPHLETHKLYGWRTTNFVESENGRALAARELHPSGFFMYYMESFMSTKYARWKEGQKWLTSKKVITDYAQKKYDKEDKTAGYLSVQMSSSTMGYVFDMRSLSTIKKSVDIAAKTCECPFMRQKGIPCSHFIAVLTHLDLKNTVYDYFDDCYLVKNYIELYNVENNHNVKLPPYGAVQTDTTVLEPVPTVNKGRNQKKRFASGGEAQSNATARPRRCGNCREIGHNARSCTGNDASTIIE